MTGDPYDPASIKVNLSETGKLIPETIAVWQKKYPIFAEQYAIMPDHIHICMNVVANLPTGLSRAVGNLMGMISKSNWLTIPEEIRPEEIESLFTKSFNDRIAYTIEQWNNQIRYTCDNPRRYLIKKLYPDYMLSRWIVGMPDNREYILRGNIFLLRQPYIFRVKTSRHYTEAEAAAAMEEWKKLLFNGAIPVSPFIHPHEKKLRDYAIDNGFAYIRICGNGFAEREAPSGREFELLSSGRTLLIGRPEIKTQKEDLKYTYAQKLNQIALEIAETCNSGARLSIRKKL